MNGYRTVYIYPRFSKYGCKLLNKNKIPIGTPAFLNLDHDVQHGSWVGYRHFGLLWIGCLDDVILRERGGHDAPNSVSIQL